jgi:hypothetical protein
MVQLGRYQDGAKLNEKGQTQQIQVGPTHQTGTIGFPRRRLRGGSSVNNTLVGVPLQATE